MRDATGRTRRTSLSRLRVATVDRPTVQPSTDRPTDRDDGGHDTHDTKNNGIEYVSLDYVYTSHASYTYMSRGHESHTFAHTRPSRSHTYVRTRRASTLGRSVARARARVVTFENESIALIMSAFTTSFTGVRVVSKTAVAKKSVSTKAVASMENVKKVRASVARGDADRSIRGGDRAVAGVVRARAWTRRRDRASTRVRDGWEKIERCE